MTESFKDMLYLLKCSVRCEEADLKKTMDYEKIGTLAMQQQIMPVIFHFIEKAHTDGVFKADLEKIDRMKKKVAVSAVAGIRREEFLSYVLKKMEEKNIVCILLKGALLADLYPSPELRLSGDVDLYVDEKDEKAAIEVLKSFGFEVKKRLDGENDSVCYHKIVKTLELHVSLYEEHCAKLWFDYIKYDMSKIKPYTTKAGYTYNALETNEQLIFNILHLIKHFLSSGAGIRQILDVILFTEKNYDDIDRENYAATMKKLKFDYFMDCCMKIGVKYFGANPDRLLWINEGEVVDEDCEKVLSDIENSGIFGHNDIERRSFNEAYTKALSEKKFSDGEEIYRKNSKKKNLFSKIFLDYNRMKGQYKYLENKKWLLPLAWIHRGLRFVFVKKKVTENQTILQKEHLKLMEDMKIL